MTKKGNFMIFFPGIEENFMEMNFQKFPGIFQETPLLNEFPKTI